jgi:tetratricopeptide (TPR) repeat protein
MPKIEPRMMRMLIVFLLLALGSFRAAAAEWENANQAYDQGKFSEAKSSYEKMLESDAGSANVYYNLANADFRLGAAGLAMLNYERALALHPHHPEAHANLKLLREQNGSRLLPVSWNARLAAMLSPNTWIILATVSGWIVIFGIVLIGTSRSDDNFGLWTISLASIAVCAIALVSTWSISKDQALAVITAKQTEARLAPAQTAGLAEALPAGSQVRVLSERGEWIYCELPGQGRGWIPVGAVERVRLGKS